jgi:TRAP-type mannitol/chloroaromatic compound transport system permease small subunit
VLAVVLVQFALVVARYVISYGSIWLTESVTYGHATLIMLAAAWTLKAGGHVRVDVFYAHASERTRALIDLAGSLLLLLPFTLVLLWLSVPYAARSWAILERSQEVGGLPLVFVLKTLLPLFALLMALQGVAQAIRAASTLTRQSVPGEG